MVCVGGDSEAVFDLAREMRKLLTSCCLIGPLRPSQSYNDVHLFVSRNKSVNLMGTASHLGAENSAELHGL